LYDAFDERYLSYVRNNPYFRIEQLNAIMSSLLAGLAAMVPRPPSKSPFLSSIEYSQTITKDIVAKLEHATTVPHDQSVLVNALSVPIVAEEKSIKKKETTFFVTFEEEEIKPRKRVVSKGRKEKQPLQPSNGSNSASSDAPIVVAIKTDERTTDMIRSEYIAMQQQWSWQYDSMWASRKFLNCRMWLCISRPQYKYSCGISSLTACWNYLYSSLGTTSSSSSSSSSELMLSQKVLKPMTQEELLLILGFRPPFDAIRFGPFTGNGTLMKWFRQLCQYFGVKGRASVLWKPHGKMRTPGMTPEIALQRLKTDLASPSVAVIYHCYNHYMCPCGFDDTPIDPAHAYASSVDPADAVTWILIGDSSKTSRSLHCVKWKDMVTDLTSQMPNYFNIRKADEGVQTRKTCKRPGGNLHCLLRFERLPDDADLVPEVGPEEDDELDNDENAVVEDD
jgi:hypothetical protein